MEDKLTEEKKERQVLLEQLETKLARVFATVLHSGAIKPNEKLTHQQSNMIRIQRALSWLVRDMELQLSDPDVSFILHWIAFESIYGTDQVMRKRKGSTVVVSTVNEIMEFLVKLEQLDTDRQRLSEAILRVWKDVIALFKNPFINPMSWTNYYKGTTKAGPKHNPFKYQKITLLSKDKLADPIQLNMFLKNMFQRLYLLRNQLFHGNATYKGNEYHARSEQIHSGAKVLQALIPMLLLIMIDSMELDNEQDHWGLIPYPRIQI